MYMKAIHMQEVTKTRSMTRVITFAILASCLLSGETLAVNAGQEAVSLSSAEKELITLADEFHDQLRIFWKRSREIEDEQEAKTFYAEHDPSNEFLPKLLAFERKHAGQDVSLDALGEIVSYAARGGDTDSPAMIARREVLQRLPVYEERELAIGAIYRLTHGRRDPLVDDYLRRLSNSQVAHPTVRAVGHFLVAKTTLKRREARPRYEQRLQSLADGVEPTRPNEEERLREFLSALPSAEELAADSEEAMATLKTLAESGDSFPLPRIRTIDPTGRIARINHELPGPVPFLSEKATAILFKEQHLRVGRQAPELELELIDGESWSLAALRGSVILLQFSSKGCVPCERMYPDLKELHEAFPERLSIVSIVHGESRESWLEAIEAGTITWNVAWDGEPPGCVAGPITARWAVTGFPEVYLIDSQGTMAAFELRGAALRKKVAELVEAVR